MNQKLNIRKNEIIGLHRQVVPKERQMKKKILFWIFLTSITMSVFAEKIVVARSKLSEVFEKTKTSEGYTPDELYRIYENNALKYENQFYHKMFVVKGEVTTIRRSIFDEYIVELECNESWITDLAIVYPKNISKAMKEKLINLSPGEHYRALVVGRKDWSYVDVPVWDEGNGVYITEP